MLKRYLTTIGAAISAATLHVSSVLGVGLNTDIPIEGLATETDITGVVLKIVGVILNVILVIAVLYVIIAGVRLIVSGGDEGQKDTAKKTIIYVIAGIIVILFAKALVIFIQTAFLET